MSKQTLIFANFLAPSLFKTYQYIVEYIERFTGLPTFLIRGETLEDFEEGCIDGGFICGLSYIHLSRQRPCPVELLAAPILQGERYQQEPRYFSDIVVRRDSTLTSFDDLQGRTWAYNERASHSGYNLVSYALLQEGKFVDYFGKMIESGSHAQSLRLILDGIADAAAIDSHVLDLVFQNSPKMAANLRVIGSFGPSTIPPVVISASLDAASKQKIKEAFLAIHQDEFFAQRLHDGLIERFTPIADEQYQDIREMYRTVQANRLIRSSV